MEKLRPEWFRVAAFPSLREQLYDPLCIGDGSSTQRIEANDWWINTEECVATGAFAAPRMPRSGDPRQILTAGLGQLWLNRRGSVCMDTAHMYYSRKGAGVTAIRPPVLALSLGRSK